VERDQRDLEAEPDQDEPDSGDHEGRGLARSQAGGHLDEVHGAGGAIEEGDPVDEEAGGKGAQDEVFESTLDRAWEAAPESRQDIEAHGHELEPDEQCDQVGALGEQQHAGRRHQNQVVILGQVDVLTPAVSHREQ
jgi:hypothetical protein